MVILGHQKGFVLGYSSLETPTKKFCPPPHSSDSSSRKLWGRFAWNVPNLAPEQCLCSISVPFSGSAVLVTLLDWPQEPASLIWPLFSVPPKNPFITCQFQPYSDQNWSLWPLRSPHEWSKWSEIKDWPAKFCLPHITYQIYSSLRPFWGPFSCTLTFIHFHRVVFRRSLQRKLWMHLCCCPNV